MNKLDQLTHAYEVIFTQYLLQKESGHDTDTLKAMLERAQQEIQTYIKA
jgi:hypothetical protein